METQKSIEFENIGIGKETSAEKLEPIPVKVIEISEVDVTFADKTTSRKLVLKVQHMMQPLEISAVRYEQKKNLKEAALWLKKDKDGMLPYNSAVANLLRFYKCSSISMLKGKELQTTPDEAGYLVIKAY